MLGSQRVGLILVKAVTSLKRRRRGESRVDIYTFKYGKRTIFVIENMF